MTGSFRLNTQSPQSAGLAFALSAFLLWGLAPVFFKQVASVSSLEVLAHRVLWSVLILGAVILALGWGRRLTALTGGLWRRVFWSSLFVSANWLIFIWSVAQSRILETSLGYFMTPLVSVLFGLLFLSERLRPAQWLAVGLAALGVANQIMLVGHLPWVALSLALTFGTYGLLRKSLPLDPVTALLAETLFLLPLAVVYLIWLGVMDGLAFGAVSRSLDAWLIASGLMTTVPLLLFAAAVQRLPLSVIGIAQYITPSMSFMLGLWVYDEPFVTAQWLTFGLIWAGLLVFSVEGYYRLHRPS